MSIPPPVGLFGKLPARGDFLSVGLPSSFSEPWHGWIARGLQAARLALGARFEEVYRVAPAWRFALAPGLAGPEAALGVLVPSVDAVGRAFPLALARLEPEAVDPVALLRSPGWFDRLEEVARRALAPHLDLNAWQSALADLAPVEPVARATPHLLPHRLEGEGHGLAEALDGLLRARGGSGLALFWGAGSPFVAAGLFAAPGLPEGPDFARLLVDPERLR